MRDPTATISTCRANPAAAIIGLACRIAVALAAVCRASPAAAIIGLACRIAVALAAVSECCILFVSTIRICDAAIRHALHDWFCPFRPSLSRFLQWAWA